MCILTYFTEELSINLVSVVNECLQSAGIKGFGVAECGEDDTKGSSL